MIPCLLTDGNALVKTVRFEERTYLGDPANVVSLFSEFEVDELLLLDIDATRDGRGPNVPLLEQVAQECIVPLAYGGGIRSADDATRVMQIGIEKVVVRSAFMDDPEVVSSIADRHGAQAVTVAIDAQVVGSAHAVRSGSGVCAGSPSEWAQRATRAGAGEILLTTVDRDGTGEGYDLALIEEVSGAVSVPVIASGGAGSRQDLVRPVREAGATAVAAGSIFVFYGRHRAVLVNFPSRRELRQLFG